MPHQSTSGRPLGRSPLGRGIAAIGVALAVALTLASTPATAAGVALPPNGRFDYQLGGSHRLPARIETVVRDRTAKPASGRYNVCYINAFQTQPDARSWWHRKHPGLLLRAAGHEVTDSAWGEILLDTSTARKRTAIAAILGRWIDRCASTGYQAIEADNLDSFTRSHKRLTAADNLALAALLITRAHRDRLAIAQKNTAELSQTGKRLGFDFAVAEECAVWQECGRYTRAYGTHVLEIEYSDNGRKTFARACRAAAGARPVILRDRDLVPAGTKGHVYRAC